MKKGMKVIVQPENPNARLYTGTIVEIVKNRIIVRTSVAIWTEDNDCFNEIVVPAHRVVPNDLTP